MIPRDKIGQFVMPFDMRAIKSKDGYWYLATPYSKHPLGVEGAFREACKLSGWMIKLGIRIYSPIAHTHPIAIHAGMDPLDHEIWMPADRPLMDAAAGLIVYKRPGWEESLGIREEVEVFWRDDKWIFGLDWKQWQ